MKHILSILLIFLCFVGYSQTNRIALSQLRFAPGQNYLITTDLTGKPYYQTQVNLDIDTRVTAGWHANDTLYLEVERVSGQSQGVIDTVKIYLPGVVDTSGYNQTLVITNDTLFLTDDNSTLFVPLTPYINTDTSGYNISFTLLSNTLSIADANSAIAVDLSPYLDNTDTLTTLLQDSILSYTTLGAEFGRDTIRLAGISNTDTVTYLIQDSILVYSEFGSEVGRDTIRLAAASGDNWGTQVVESGTTLIGTGIIGNLLDVDTTIIATQFDISDMVQFVDTLTTIATQYDLTLIPGDNWGSQVVETDVTLTGTGIIGNTLKVDTTIIATQNYVTSQNYTTPQNLSQVLTVGNDATSQSIANILNIDIEGYADIGEIATPGSPVANTVRLWSETDGGFTQLHFKDANGLDHQLSRDNIHTVRNVSGSQINKGQWVYISGSNGVFPTIALARADNVATMPVAGIAVADIANNDFGQIMSHGDVQGINTSSFIDGDVIYISEITAGLATTTEPTGTNLSQRIGVVVKSSVGAGIIAVLIGGEDDPTSTQTLTNKTISTVNNNITIEEADISDLQAYYLASNPAGYTTNTGTVTSVGTGFGLTGGPITTAGTIEVDTTAMATQFDISEMLVNADTTSLLATKFDILDMVEFADTVSIVATKDDIVDMVEFSDTLTTIATQYDLTQLALGEVNTASNLGSGDTIFYQKTGVNLEFKSLTEGSGIEFNTSASEIEIKKLNVLAPFDTTATAYTLALADMDRRIYFSSGSDVIVTIPLNATVAFPVGTILTFVRDGVGELDVAVTGGVTLNSADGYRSCNKRYQVMELHQKAIDEWRLIGDLKL